MMPNFANVLSAVRDRTMNPSNPSTPGGNGLITAPSTQEIQRLLPQATVRTEDAMETAHLSLLEQMYRTQEQAQSNPFYSISATAVDPHAVSDYSSGTTYPIPRVTEAFSVHPWCSQRTAL